MLVWMYLDAEGGAVGSSDEFDDREAAESWLGIAWQELLERGVEEVSLVDGEAELYRMGLREE